MYLNRGFQSPGEFEDYLNGVVTSAKAFAGAFTGAFSLDTLDLVIDIGSGDVTVTFTGDPLTLNQVVEQINTALSENAASIRNYGRNAPAGSVLAFTFPAAIVKKTGTANALLGLSTTTNLSVTPIAKAKIVAVMQDPNSRTFWVLHE